jgi:hypothetical protein
MFIAVYGAELNPRWEGVTARAISWSSGKISGFPEDLGLIRGHGQRKKPKKENVEQVGLSRVLGICRSEFFFTALLSGSSAWTGVKPEAPTLCLIVIPFSHMVACHLELREGGSP